MGQVISLNEYRAKKQGYIKIAKVIKRYTIAMNSLVGKTDDGLYVALHTDYPLNDMLVWPKPSEGRMIKVTPDLKSACKALWHFQRKERERLKNIRDTVYKAYYGSDNVGFMIRDQVIMLDFVHHNNPYANHVNAIDLETLEQHIILDGHNLERLVKYLAGQHAKPVTFVEPVSSWEGS